MIFDGTLLKHLLAKFETYKIMYSKGFYKLAVLFNSPQTVYQSSRVAPFSKHDEKKNRVDVNFFLLNGFGYYKKIENGLWLIASQHQYKKNVTVKNIIDPTLSAEYYLLNIYTNNHEDKPLTNAKTDNMLSDKDSLRNKTWSFFKPKVHQVNSYFKDNCNKNITLFFTKEWLLENTYNQPFFQNSSFQNLVDSPAEFHLLYDEKYTENFFEKVIAYMDTSVGSDENELKFLKELTLTMFRYFTNRFEEEGYTQNHFNLNNQDRNRIKQAEDILKKHIYDDFPGLETLADSTGYSLSKFKTDFKNTYNVSPYQYFSDLQMDEAKKELEKGELSVTQIATLFRYSNASKFSVRFKNHFGILPSEVTITKKS